MPSLSFDLFYRDHGAQKGLQGLGRESQNTHARFKSMAIQASAMGNIVATAVTKAAGAAVKFGKDSVSAYVEAQQSQIRLQAAFDRFPKLADTNITALQRLNAQLALKTRYDDDATGSGQAVLAQFGLTGKQITQLTPLLQDYAARTGKDLPAAATVLGKAVLGQGRALRGVGINFKDAKDQGKNFDQIMGGLRRQVGGFAEREGKSAAGQAEILKNQFGELQESVGQQLLPILMKVGSGVLRLFGFIQDNAAVFGSFRKIASETFGAFSDAVGLGKLSFKSFADWVKTHQADIVTGFSTGAKIVLAFGHALADLGSVGLKAFAFLMDSQADMTALMLLNFKSILHGSALAFGWIPGVGDKLKAADSKFDGFARTAVGGMRKAAAVAREAAVGIDTKLTPALDAADRKLDQVSRREIWKAKQRDQAEQARRAIQNIGTQADGTQLHLKRFNDITRLGGTEQAALMRRIDDARSALVSQITTMRRAGASQDDLSQAWRTGRQRLYDEFVQMGLSKREAGRLADKYADVGSAVRRLPKGHTIKLNWDTAVDGFNTKMYASHGKMALQMSAFHDGGYTGAKDPLAVAGVVHGDEHVIRSSSRKKIEAENPGALDYMNKFGKIPGYYEGGRVAAALESQGSQLLMNLGSRAIGAALKKLSVGGAGPVGAIDVSHPRNLTSYHGGTFTNLFLANLRRAEHAAGRQFVIYQGGFRPSTSYSGSTHNMDAIDAQVDYKLLRAYRRYVGAIGDRTGLGNWMSHMHGVPAPGHGYGSPSARAQYRDYLARGGASQSPKSPWGLASGGLLTARVAEHGPERLLNAPVTRRFDDMVRVLERSGGVVIHNHYTVNAPNYVGAQNDLVKALVTLDKHNRLPGSRR